MIQKKGFERITIWVLALLIAGGFSISPVQAEDSKSSQPVKKMDVEFEESQTGPGSPAAGFEDDWDSTYDPIEEFRVIQQRLKRMLEPWMSEAGMGRMAGGMGPMGLATNVRADFEETLEEYIVMVDLPGYKKEEIQVELKKNALVVEAKSSGAGEKSEELEGRKVISRERHHGVVKRMIRFPQPVKEEGVSAKFENGVLTVRVPKAEPEKSVQVQVA